MHYLSVVIYLLFFVNEIFAQQDFYKIILDYEGIYQISGQELSDVGISIGQINPDQIQLFSDGNETLPYSTSLPSPQLNEISIFVDDGNDGSFDSMDYILFYGQASNRFQKHNLTNDFTYVTNPYDTLSFYWMRFNVENGKRIALINSSPINPSAISKDNYVDRIHLERDKFNPLKSGINWTWNLFKGYDVFDVNYNLANIENNSAELNVNFSKYTFYPNYVNTGQVEIISNGSMIGLFDVNSSAYYSMSIPVQNNQNLLQINYIPFSNQDTLAQVGVNWLELEVERSTELSDIKQKVFIDSLNTVIHLKYKSASNSDSILIFDVTDPFNVTQRLTSNDTLFEDTLSAQSKIYYLNKFNTYEQILSIEQTYRHIISAANGADYIIICPADWQTELSQLQSHRISYNGFAVKIVPIEDIFDEFGFGRKDPTAIRNFIKFAYENWNPQPKYILLAGNGYYDYKNITGDYPDNWVPPFEIDADLNELNSRAVDDFFVDINYTKSEKQVRLPWSEKISGFWEIKGNFGYEIESDLYFENFQIITPDLSIGRFPADDIYQISDLVQKTINYEANIKPGLWRMSSLLIADDTNPDGIVFTSSTENLFQYYFQYNSRVRKLYETDYPLVGNEKPGATKNLINHFNQGKRISTFIGHASEYQWTHENLLNLDRDLHKIQNTRKESFFLGIGKLYKYDDLQEGILDVLIKNQDSGFISTLTANRLVYSSSSITLFSRFLSNIINEGYTNGEALLLAKNGVINSQKYHLLGDPALSISFPQKKIVQIDITPDTIKAGSLVLISGQILEPINEDSLIIEVISPGKQMNINSLEYQTSGNTIFRGSVILNNNNFTTQFVVPINQYSDTVSTGGNLYGYLWDSDSESMIIYDSLLFGGIDTSATDSIPPQINMSLVQKDTVTNPSFLKAVLYDESGINLYQTGSNSCRLIFDNSSDTMNVCGYFIYNTGSYQQGEINYPLPSLQPGTHLVTLIVSDNYGNIATDSIDFIISGTENPDPNIPSDFILSQNYPNPFNMQTTIAYEIIGKDAYNVKIEIFNILGQKVFEFVRPNLSGGRYEWIWNATNSKNIEVSSGIYIYRFVAQNLKNKSNILLKSKKMLLIK